MAKHVEADKRLLSTIGHYPGIYAIINTIDGKRYIGSSSRIRKRLKKHIYLLRENKHFSSHLQNAWNAYGEDSFICQELATVANRDELKDMEQRFLDQYKSYLRENGYNTSQSAHHCVHTDESKALLRKANLGKRYSTEINLKKGSPGELNYFWNKSNSREIVIANLEKRGLIPDPFICVETGQIFETYHDAIKSLKVRGASVPACLSGKLYVTRGLHFIYVDKIPFTVTPVNGVIPLTDLEKAKLIAIIDPRRRLFMCNETEEVFSSVNKAGKQFNICRVYISRCLANKVETFKSHTFSYI